jgi:hypothetical protein
MSERRFPPPWSVEEQDACFVVKDAAGQKLQGRDGLGRATPCTALAGDKGKQRNVEVNDYGFGVSMPVTTSRSDGGGSTVGRVVSPTTKGPKGGSRHNIGKARRIAANIARLPELLHITQAEF